MCSTIFSKGSTVHSQYSTNSIIRIYSYINTLCCIDVFLYNYIESDEKKNRRYVLGSGPCPVLESLEKTNILNYMDFCISKNCE